MAARKIGPGTYQMSRVGIKSTAAIVGPKEGEGPLRTYFDEVWESETHQQKSVERAERMLLEDTMNLAVEKAGCRWPEIDLVLGGDLLDQIVSTNFVARRHQRPLLGLFSACAVFTEALGLGGLLVADHEPTTVAVGAVSHHMAAERQFRFPVELGYQRTPTAAWTATAAGAVVVGPAEVGHVVIDGVTFGRVVDWGSKDPNDMGSAMAPAAFDTIKQHLVATGDGINDYDAIFTGDLGVLGVDLLQALGNKEGLHFDDRLNDCGKSLYYLKEQDVHNGASGPGCSASVFAGYLHHRLLSGEWRRLLLVATGALFSPTTYQQGESIPCIAHAVSLGRPGAKLS
jgi:stage V sporulation protein AD